MYEKGNLEANIYGNSTNMMQFKFILIVKVVCFVNRIKIVIEGYHAW